ncbi:MAG: TetR/AcrR family transcriptional regulator [Polyangiaceae bacterium]|nr:TetR/AcrR family transcriptional regulator [Polyangiaceae bacterium]MCW5792379.1 TetR/AcrR family transcriptional regulator [Polyangiaceae bacterium]
MASSAHPPRPSSRARVLRAASELFSSQGYGGTSIDQIASLAAASPSSIYWHFKGGKEEILVAVLEEAAAAYLARLTALIEGERTLLQKLDVFLLDVRDQMMSQPDDLRLIMQLAVERAHVGAGVRERLQHIYRTYRRALVSELSRVLPSEPVHRLERSALLCVAILEGVFLQWQLDPDDVDLDGALHVFRVLVYRQYGGARVPSFAEVAKARGAEAPCQTPKPEC